MSTVPYAYEPGLEPGLIVRLLGMALEAPHRGTRLLYGGVGCKVIAYMKNRVSFPLKTLSIFNSLVASRTRSYIEGLLA